MNVRNKVKASDVMKQSFVQLDGMQSTREALEAMKANDIEVVIVNKRDQHDAYGILLLSDIAKQVLAKDRSLDRVNIYEVMSKPVLSVTPELDVRYCARLFDKFGISCAPVISAEEVLGVVGYKELLLSSFENLD